MEINFAFFSPFPSLFLSLLLLLSAFTLSECQEMKQATDSNIHAKNGCRNPHPHAEEAQQVFTCIVDFLTHNCFSLLNPPILLRLDLVQQG